MLESIWKYIEGFLDGSSWEQEGQHLFVSKSRAENLQSYTRPGLSCFSVTASLVKMLSLVESIYQQRVTMGL